jgi:cell division protein FtsA
MDGLIHIKKQKKISKKEEVASVQSTRQNETTALDNAINIEEEDPRVDLKPRKNILEKWTEKFKEFLDNAE